MDAVSASDAIPGHPLLARHRRRTGSPGRCNQHWSGMECLARMGTGRGYQQPCIRRSNSRRPRRSHSGSLARLRHSRDGRHRCHPVDTIPPSPSVQSASRQHSVGQTHVSPSHISPDRQVVHAAPPRPQLFTVTPSRHVAPSQQPLQLAGVQVGIGGCGGCGVGGQSVPQQSRRWMQTPSHNRSLGAQSQVPLVQTRLPAHSLSAQQASTACTHHSRRAVRSDTPHISPRGRRCRHSPHPCSSPHTADVSHGHSAAARSGTACGASVWPPPPRGSWPSQPR